LVSAIPILFASGLALLYLVGAGVKAIQLTNADIEIADGLSLVPVDQVLSIGIGTTLREAPFIAALALTALVPTVIFGWFELTERQTQTSLIRVERTTMRASGRRERRLLLLPWLPLSLVAVITLPPLLASGMAAAILVMLAAQQLAYGLPPTARRWSLVGAMWLVTCIGLITVVLQNATAFQPLPEAQVRTHNGTQIRGRLVVINDGTWYLTHGPRQISTIPAEEIQSARIESRFGHGTGPSVGSRLVGLVF
jgi:hypothetical protein